MFKAFLLKYAEIGVKGKNRYLFEDALVKQVRLALDKVDGDFEITKVSGRVYVTANGEFDYDETVGNVVANLLIYSDKGGKHL